MQGTVVVFKALNQTPENNLTPDNNNQNESVISLTHHTIVCNQWAPTNTLHHNMYIIRTKQRTLLTLWFIT